MRKPISILAIAALTLSACASSIKKHDFPPTANATAEIDRLEAEMSVAIHDQVNVLSPNNFAAAREKLDEAKKENQNRESTADVLDDLGYAKAYLDAANRVAPRAQGAMPEVLRARKDALDAEAVRLRNADLIDADDDLRKTTQDFENGSPTVSVAKRGELQKNYLDIELASIKVDYLNEAKSLVEAAKKMGAEKYGEETLRTAEAKVQDAERTIESDRHDTAAITRAADAATLAAKHAVEITRLAKGIQEESPEEIAIALEAKRNEAARNSAEAERNSARLDLARKTIQDKNSEISAIDTERSNLEKERRFNLAFANARKSFTPDEAEVYRQGNKLVIRLKSIKFPSGRSQIPDSSFDVLEKVKDVMTSMDARKVIVEGHTDATGSSAKNEKLSEARADAVAKYFVAEAALPAGQIEAKGYGDTRPLASNKTTEGRAENRRVDIVISAAGPDTTRSTSTSTSMSSAIRRSSGGARSLTAPPPPQGSENSAVRPDSRLHVRPPPLRSGEE
jgi:outer membrane protein OmpA-like peptidoglycan-associated protein